MKKMIFAFYITYILYVETTTRYTNTYLVMNGGK